MKVTLKLYASLGSYLPQLTSDRAIDVDTRPGTTPNQLLDRFGVPHQLAHLVVLNGVYVPPGERDTSVLNDSDTLAVWPPVAGG